MLKLYTVTYIITATEENISFEQFKEHVAPSLQHVRHLMGILRKEQPVIKFFQGNPPSVKAIVSVSFGKDKAEHLAPLANAIGDPMAFEMPQCKTNTEVSQYDVG